MLELRTTREVSALLGVPEWVIESAIRRREVDRPPIVGRTRLWTEAHVNQLRAALGRRREGEAPAASPVGRTS